MKEITCEKSQDLILKDLDEDLDFSEEQSLTNHIAQCDKCAHAKIVYGRIYSSLAGAAPEDPGAPFWEEHLKDMKSKIKEKGGKRKRGWGWAPAYVAASVIIVISVSLYGLWNIHLNPLMDITSARSIVLELDHVYGPVTPENGVYDIYGFKSQDLDIKFALDDPSLGPCWFEVEESAYNSLM